MYAVVSDGGFQYRVEEGQVIDVQRRDLPEGTQMLTLERVLLVGGLEGGPKIGTPTVAGASVNATVLGERKEKKIVIQKFRRRKNYARKQGHRQKLLQLRIDRIVA